jgi:hypothetical protein
MEWAGSDPWTPRFSSNILDEMAKPNAELNFV